MQRVSAEHNGSLRRRGREQEPAGLEHVYSCRAADQRAMRAGVCERQFASRDLSRHSQSRAAKPSHLYYDSITGVCVGRGALIATWVSIEVEAEGVIRTEIATGTCGYQDVHTYSASIPVGG